MIRQRTALPPQSTSAASPEAAGELALERPRFGTPAPAREPVAAAALPWEGSGYLRVPLHSPERARGNSTGMPDRLKSGLENLSGLAMDDVRVHYNSPRPAPLQALAYTQGTQIYLGPGQEEHLAHEAWHAVQQKQGRVIPIRQLRGTSLNDDSFLEREADVMGARAMTGPPREAGAALQPGVQPQGEVVQRRVGFEFEAAGGWKFEAQEKADDSWKEIKHTKASLVPTANNQGNISADNGNVEFRTEPLSTLAEVTTTINQLLGLRNRFRGRTTQLADAEKIFALGKVNAAADLYKEVRVLAGAGLITRPQATLGVKVVDIPKLFAKLVEIRGNERGKAGQGRLQRDYEDFDRLSLQRIVAGGVQANASDAIADAQGYYQRAVATAAQAGTAEPPGVKDEIVGLLTMVARILRDAATTAPNVDDMKIAFPLMARTDIRSMFSSLEANAQAFLGTLWNSGNGPLATEIGSLGSRTFPNGYKGDDGQVYQGPTRLAWLRSIFEAGQQNHGRDLLSPAPGYNRLEGFGSLSVDDTAPKLALLEFRGLATFRNTATIGSDDWLILAQTFFNLTDSLLNPPAAAAPPAANAAAPNALAAALLAAAADPAPPPPPPAVLPAPLPAADPAPPPAADPAPPPAADPAPPLAADPAPAAAAAAAALDVDPDPDPGAAAAAAAAAAQPVRKRKKSSDADQDAAAPAAPQARARVAKKRRLKKKSGDQEQGQGQGQGK